MAKATAPNGTQSTGIEEAFTAVLVGKYPGIKYFKMVFLNKYPPKKEGIASITIGRVIVKFSFAWVV